ncbi:mRNA-binding protein PUF3 [Candida viswanathii]|uniref:Pumilio homology domain family member 3 n=1 Tax=Candida viswanathii TaxID=5486 RepID=A0A367XSR3_9ASCO|nr:mRNA-binding protein PUF3 [Candida viswanathii]
MSSSTTTTTTTANGTQYKSVIDQVDPEVVRLFASSNSFDPLASSNTTERRLSFNDGSDILDNDFFGFKRGALSAITAPVVSSNNHVTNKNFGTASISGGIANRHPPQDSFLQKFASVADATREIELGRLSLDDHRGAPTGESLKVVTTSAFTSPHGSLNENLNMPAPQRGSRHQSISEKIDNYNNSSPIQASSALSISSDLNSDHGGNGAAAPTSHNFWNPATAASFTPAGQTPQNYFMDMNGMPMPPPPPPPQGFYPQRGGAPANNTNSGMPISPPPPFMIPSPPPFMDPSLYSMMYGNFPPPPPPPPSTGTKQQQQPQSLSHTSSESGDDVKNESDDKEAAEKDGKKKDNHGPGPIGGVGLMNRQFSPASFMFHPFNPYSVYQQSPPLMPHEAAMRGMTPPPPHPPMGMPPQMESPPPPFAASGAPQSHQGPPTSKGDNGKHEGGSKRKSNHKGKNGNNGNGGGNGGNHIYRSPLLEEVRANPKSFNLKDIYGHAVEFTKDQHGSRFIQQKLPDATEEEKETIFNEIWEISYDLMTDVFGNYVIQKYFEHGNNTQKQVLLESMIGHIHELSLQMYGCRVVQRALEAIETEGQLRIIEELKDHILVCCKDQNGNHVIQKSIERIKPFSKIRFILTSLDTQIYHLSTHPYGCRVIQRLLEFSDEDDQKMILTQLNNFLYYLILDQYGNYVIQHILENGTNQEKEPILEIVLGSVVQFSKHKFASNVIEKCIKFGDLNQRKRILHEVMLGNEDINDDSDIDDDSPLALMVKDQFGNYVIQKLVEAFDVDERKLLIVKIKKCLSLSGNNLASIRNIRNIIDHVSESELN